MTFLYFSNMFWLDLLRKVYGVDISSDFFEYVSAQAKVFDNVKAYKNKVLSQMQVSYLYEKAIYLTTNSILKACWEVTKGKCAIKDLL